ncbi:MAG TPA: DUF3089 domain-containing protein, partial [Caulobacteraceae bacterium]|nr:DUF3089 domain-containing protein [Caulobacteraceae bacterium]
MNEALKVLAARVHGAWRRLGLHKLSARGRWICFASVALALVLAVTLAATWDDIMRTGLDPKEPFQTYRPPPAPNYAQSPAWALIPPSPARTMAGDPPADVFFIHPTTFDGGRNWNGPIDDPWTQRLLDRVMLPNYAGPFLRVGRVFAPHYRQASLYAHFTLREDARAARVFAYGDVLAAFRYYLVHYNQGRPIILVGVEQGGLLGDRLLREEIDRNPDVASRLAAAYLIDTIVRAKPYEGAVPTPACQQRQEAHCVLAWRSVEESDPNKAKELLARALVWTADDQLETLGQGQQALCVNPLLGAQTTDKAPARANLGAANATELEWGVRPPFLPRQVSTQCAGGILWFSHPSSGSLRP